jgi:serine/threonine protein kinase
MSRPHYPRAKVGSRIGPDLTVLDVVDETPGRHAVYVVWSDSAWAPLACKLFGSARKAERESAILRSLDHPNVVRCFAPAMPGCVLTEFLEGPSLGRLVGDAPQGRLTAGEAIRVAIHLGAALNHVHQRGFVHLDVKPGNVIVARGRPVLFDFGWARPLDGARPAEVAGTDPYIAPEEYRRETVTPAADVFSLGVVLYESLTGELPFGEPTRRRPFPQLELPPTPVRRHRPRLRAGLDEVVLACLARDPHARPKLPELLTRLHGFIGAGPRMWPDGFEPQAPAIPALAA